MTTHLKDNYDRHLIASSATIGDALQRLNGLSGDALTLFVTDDAGRVAGSLTDGDVRRGLLSGRLLTDSVSDVMNRNFRRALSGADNLEVFMQSRQLHIALLPMVDSEGRPVGIIDLSEVRSMLPLDAVLMAGGKGVRLRPLTVSTPKPLLEVGGKPIIDYNVDALERCGVARIFVTVNYLHEQIERHFAVGRRGGAEVRCVRETEPLGTFGAVTLVDGLSHENLLVMNSDLLTDIDYEAMYLHHRHSEAALTMAVIPYTVSVPYAILQTDGDRVRGMEEKPTYNYLANAGVYIMNRKYLGLLEKGTRIDAPDFIDMLIARGEKVSYYLIDGTWIDIGSPDDYRYASTLMERRNGLGQSADRL